MVTRYSATGDGFSSTQNPSLSVDAGTDANRVLLVLVTSADSADHDHPNVPTYNGVAMTQVDSTFFMREGDTTGPGKRVASLYKLADPATGSNTLTVDFGASRTGSYLLAVVLHGADDVGATARSNDATGSDNNPTVTFTPNNSDSHLLGLAGGDAGNLDPYSPGTGVTELLDSDAFANPQLNHAAWCGEKTGSGSQTIDATQSSNGEWVIWGVEVTNAAADATGQVSWAELEVPTAPRHCQISWAELETPTPPRAAGVSWAEMEVPLAPRKGVVSWAEMEVPTAPRHAQVSWAEFEVPATDAKGQVSWAEMQVPDKEVGDHSGYRLIRRLG